MITRKPSRLMKLLRLTLALIVLASGASVLALSCAAKKMVSPPRSPLKNHHREWMSNPQEHGIRIVSTSCLLVEPVGVTASAVFWGGIENAVGGELLTAEAVTPTILLRSLCV